MYAYTCTLIFISCIYVLYTHLFTVCNMACWALITLLVTGFSQLRPWFERVWNHALSAASPDPRLRFHSSAWDHDPTAEGLGIHTDQVRNRGPASGLTQSFCQGPIKASLPRGLAPANVSRKGPFPGCPEIVPPGLVASLRAERPAVVNSALKQWWLSLHITSCSDLYMDCVYPCFREALEFPPNIGFIQDTNHCYLLQTNHTCCLSRNRC